jgi:hypothetical protein
MWEEDRQRGPQIWPSDYRETGEIRIGIDREVGRSGSKTFLLSHVSLISLLFNLLDLPDLPLNTPPDLPELPDLPVNPLLALPDLPVFVLLLAVRYSHVNRCHCRVANGLRTVDASRITWP